MDDPLDQILPDLRAWIDLGSHLDRCRAEYERSIADAVAAGDVEDQPSMEPVDLADDVLPILFAMILNMVTPFNHAAVAYAMDETHLYLTEDELEAFEADSDHP